MAAEHLGIVGPAECCKGPERRGEPGVEDVGVAPDGENAFLFVRYRDGGLLVIDDQHGCTGNSAVMLRSERRSFLFGFGDAAIAVVIAQSRNPVPPPAMATNAPRLDILPPVDAGLFPPLGHEIDSAA